MLPMDPKPFRHTCLHGSRAFALLNNKLINLNTPGLNGSYKWVIFSFIRRPPGYIGKDHWCRC